MLSPTQPNPNPTAKNNQITHENVDHVSVGYIDDVSHVVGLDTKEELEVYLEELYLLLEHMNHNKRLQINGGKTQVLTIENKREDDFKIRIKIDAATQVQESETIKILGFILNRRNTLDSHLNAVASKIGLALSKLKPALSFMSSDLRKRIVTAKVKPIATYGSQLVLGQSQNIIQRACALIMRANRAMFTNIDGLRSTSAICNKLKIDEPRQELVKACFSHIHKIIENKKPQQIVDKLKLPSRSSGKVYLKGGIRSVRSSKSHINAAIELYNAIPADFRTLKHKKMKSKLKKVNIQYSVFK